jgi:hypothetical protein
MVGTDLRFKVTVSNSTMKLKFEDTTPYTTLLTHDNTSGILKITDPTGTVIYENVGFAQSNFRSPDIISKSSLQSFIEGILMSGTSSNILSGDYIIDYKVSVVDNIEKTVELEGVAATSSFIVHNATSDDLVNVGYFVVNAGSNAGSYKIVSSNFTGGTLTIVTDVTVTNYSTAPTSILDTSTFDVVQTQKVFSYCYKRPVVDILHEVSCSYSTLTSTDNTNYNAEINGVPTQPTVLTRTHSVSAPLGSGFGNIADSPDKIRMFGGIWTKQWQTAISTYLEYNVSLWGTTPWVVITDTVGGNDAIDVNCSSCLCNLQTCMVNVYNQWIAAQGTSQVLAEALGRDVLRLNALYVQYIQNERCGTDNTGICEEMASILKGRDCECGVVEDDQSKLVESVDGITPYVGLVEGVLTYPFAFESNQMGTLEIPSPIEGTIEYINYTVTQEIESTDDALVQLAIGNTDIATTTIAKGTVYGTSLPNINVSQYVEEGDIIRFTTSKTSNGGSIMAIIKYTK